MRRQIPGWLLLLWPFLVGAIPPPQDAEILIELPALGSEAEEALPPLARVRLALALADDTAAATALDRDGIPAAVRAWLRARLDPDPQSALAGFTAARGLWQEREEGFTAPEPDGVLAHFDREHLEAALAAGDLAAVRTVTQDPLGDHEGDARWEAMLALEIARSGDADTARAAFEVAWASASRRERAAPAFAHRALLLGELDPDVGGEAWLDHVEAVRTPAGIRAAKATWDAHPQLREWLDRDGLRPRAIRWLSRVLRREEALEIARSGLAQAEPDEAATCHVAVAEQLYRLRRHSELLEHLGRPRPAALSDEDRAALDAYPWGVRRRSGTSIEVAEGFDEVVIRYRSTRRAVEALWEAAWMWELSGEPEIARDRYTEYATRHPNGPFAAAAGVRAVYLPFATGNPQAALDAYDEVSPALGSSMDRVMATWIQARALAALGRGSESDQVHADLRREFPFNPLQTPPPFPLEVTGPAGRPVRDPALARIAQLQRDAFATVGAHLGVDPWTPNHPELRLAARLLELGIFGEGEARLAAFAAEDRRDAARQFRVAALAWRYGRPERQARTAYQLRLLLQGQGEDLDRALDVVAHPVPFARDILRTAQERGLPAGLLWGLMRRESFYEADVVSLAGAHGLMQLLPSTAQRMADRLGDPWEGERSLHRPLVNVRYGTAYLQGLLEEGSGDVYRALAAYNAGERNGERWAARRRDGAPPQEMNLLISYSETRAYVYHVLRFWRLYSETYPPIGELDGLLP